MPPELVVPASLMTAALACYSLGVWAERLRRELLPWHLVAFWLGLALDTAGTHRMFLLLRAGVRADLHTAFGVAALALMAAHAVWATVVLLRGSQRARHGFHRYSLAVWILWLVPYAGGMIAGMMRGLRG